MPTGRWVVRGDSGDETTHVLIVEELSAGKLNRKQRRIKSSPEPASLKLTRVTVVDASGADLPRAERIADAVATIERALHARAIASRDVTAPLGAPDWIGMRIGTGSGEQVAHGDWLEAEEIPHPLTGKPSRRRAEPDKIRFAEVLGGRGSDEESATLRELPTLLAGIRSRLAPRPKPRPESESQPEGD